MTVFDRRLSISQWRYVYFSLIIYLLTLEWATVIAVCILTDDPKEYVAQPFVISGTCKTEDYQVQHRLLHHASDTLIYTQRTSGCRLYYIAIDGDSQRRCASALLTLTHTIEPTSPIFDCLSPLSLFNLKCGEVDLTMDFDWKHVLKHF